MSLALPTLTLLFLLTPGIIFRRFYFTGEFSEEYFKSTFSELLFSTIFPSVIINLFCYCCVMYWYPLDVSTFAVLISGTDNSNEVSEALSNVYTHKAKIVSFLIFTTCLGGASGFFIKYRIRKQKIDRRHRMFRFANRWHYLLSGEILDYPDFPGRSEDVHLRYVDILVDTEEGSVLYSGVVKDYLLNKEGGLDSIYLSEAKRRYLKDDNLQSKPNTYYFLPGNLFVIPFEHIKNIHITYYSVRSRPQVQSQLKKVVLPP